MIDKIREIKFNRLKPELLHLYNSFNNLEEYRKGDTLYYHIDNMIYLQYSEITKRLYVKTEVFSDLLKYTKDIMYMDNCVRAVVEDLYSLCVGEIYTQRKLFKK